MLKFVRLLSPVVLLALFACPALAAGGGQEELDKATDAKLGAVTMSDLDEVIRLCDGAIQKGLDESNLLFAKKLLASTCIQRAQETVKQIVSGVSSAADFRHKRDAALDDLRKAIKTDPTQADAYLLLGQLNLLPDGDHKLAKQSIDKAIELGLDDPDERAKALMLRAAMQPDMEKKLGDLNEAVRLTPGDAAAIRARGLLLGDMNKLEAAAADLKKATELEPDDETTYEAYSVVLARLKKFPEALAILDKARQANAESPLPLIQRARINSTWKKNKAAIDDLNQALALDENNIVALLLRAGLYQEEGDKQKAMADIDRAAKLRPNLPLIIRTRAMLLVDDDKFEEAVAELEKLHKLDPKDTLTMLQLALIYGAQKKTDKAIETYTTLLAEDPSEWRALRGRGDCYLNSGKQVEAIADYEKAVKIEPDDQGILNNLAWVLATSTDQKLRNGARAVELAKKACDVSEYKLAFILSTLAAAYAESGDFHNAVKWSTKAVELGEKGEKESLKKELESYKAQKPWRESLSDEKSAAK
jgi:tetratricopeptide (TPR) repeat protein